MKKIYKRLLFVGLVSTIGFMSSCEKDYIIPEPVDPNGPPTTVDTIFFSTDIQPFFDAKCASCHNGGGIPLNLSPGVSYDALITGNYINTTTPASSKLYVKIAPGGSMAQYSTSAETEMTFDWIDQGALNN